jgi:hypothetical protein
MHCFAGETIAVLVQKKNLKKATIISLNNYLYPVVLVSFLFVVSLLGEVLYY